MDFLRDQVEEMLADEEKASDEYVQLANDLYSAGLPKSDAVKIFNIAKDEWRHHGILRELLKKL